MTWSGSLNNRETSRQRRRQRNNSNSSTGSGSDTRDSPSPKVGDDRISPVQSDYNQSTPMLFRYTPPLQPTSEVEQPNGSQSLDGASFAGSKFNDPPAPELLPKPPAHWTMLVASRKQASHLQMIFKVAATHHA